MCVGVQFVEMANNVGLQLPRGWRKVMDSEQKVSFVHHENWTFNTQRMSKSDQHQNPPCNINAL